MAKVMIDTCAIVSFVNKEDSLHERAVQLFKELDGEEQYINEHVYSEVLNVVDRRMSREAAQEMAVDLLNNLSVLQVMPSEFEYAQETYCSTKNLSFVDCTLLASMRAMKIERIVTFDKEFEAVKKITVVK